MNEKYTVFWADENCLLHHSYDAYEEMLFAATKLAREYDICIAKNLGDEAGKVAADMLARKNRFDDLTQQLSKVRDEQRSTDREVSTIEFRIREGDLSVDGLARQQAKLDAARLRQLGELSRIELLTREMAK